MISMVSSDGCNSKFVDPCVVVLYKCILPKVKTTGEPDIQVNVVGIVIVSPTAKPLPAPVICILVNLVPVIVIVKAAPVPLPLVVTPSTPTVKFCVPFVIPVWFVDIIPIAGVPIIKPPST